MSPDTETVQNQTLSAHTVTCPQNHPHEQIKYVHVNKPAFLNQNNKLLVDINVMTVLICDLEAVH